MTETAAARILGRPLWIKIAGGIFAAIAVVVIVLGMYWSRMPKIFWVNEFVDNNRTVVGYSTTDTLVRVASTLLDKPGGYLTNDKLPPGLYLDNIPNWEKGASCDKPSLAAKACWDRNITRHSSR